jgi:hypothetical protein
MIRQHGITKGKRQQEKAIEFFKVENGCSLLSPYTSPCWYKNSNNLNPEKRTIIYAFLK